METFCFRCVFCNLLLDDCTGLVVLEHMKNSHRFTKPFSYRCQVPSCGQLVNNFETLRRHHSHKTSIALVPIAQEIEPFPLPVVIEAETDNAEESHYDPYLEEATPAPVENSTSHNFSLSEPLRRLSNIQWKSGTLLHLRETFYIPFEALELIDSALEEYAERRIESFKTRIQARPNRPDDDFIRDLLVDETDDDIHLTRSKMETSWSKEFPSVSPLPVILNPGRPGFQWAKKAGTIEEVEEVGYLVPFLSAVEQFISVKEVYNLVQNSFDQLDLTKSPPPHSLPQRIIKDIWDGTSVRSNSIFIKYQGRVLGFQLYYDDVELSNPLGSRKGKNKLSFFYWTLLNLPSSHRSNLRAIQLLGCVNSDLLKKCGVDAFLKPFLDDMAKLGSEEGVLLKTRGFEKVWHGILINWAGDMPASNFIAGMKETGSALRPCRVCFITHEDQNKIFRESECVLRNKESYFQQITEMTEKSLTRTARSQLSVKYGLNRPCAISNALPYFDPTHNFSHDLMHVAYEGVLNSGVCLLLDYLIKNTNFELDLINHCISSLTPSREFTRPPPIRADEIKELKKLSYSSSEMSSLSSILPMIIAEQYPELEEDPYYSNFILLLEIFATLSSYSFTEGALNELANNIAIHNLNFLKLYPNQNITPKLHCLLHFPSQIRQFGPPRQSWCFRFESKNAPFKKVNRRICNFANVPKTMANHCQKLFGLDIVFSGESDDFLGTKVKVLKFKSKHTLKVKHCVWSKLLAQSLPNKFTDDTLVQLVSSVRLSGRICGIGSLFLKTPRKSHDCLPLFWLVSDMLYNCVNGSLFFIMKECSTLSYESQSFSFIVKPKESDTTVIAAADLIHVVPLQFFFYKNNYHVIPNYYPLL